MKNVNLPIPANLAILQLRMKKRGFFFDVFISVAAICIFALFFFSFLERNKVTSPPKTLPSNGSPSHSDSRPLPDSASLHVRSSSPLPQGAHNYSLEEARRVLEAIEKVQAESSELPSSGRLREIVITESELNSYIAYRIETEGEEILKELRLKLFERNRIEGKIYLDLRGRDIPSFLRPELNFYFSADVVVSSGLVKMDVKELFLEDEPIQIQLLDLVIGIASKLSGQEPVSLNDWYALPYGLKDIKTQRGEARFYY